MKNILAILIITATLFFACKSQKDSAPSAKSGINTSRSNIKNDVDTTKNKSENKEKK